MGGRQRYPDLPPAGGASSSAAVHVVPISTVLARVRRGDDITAIAVDSSLSLEMLAAILASPLAQALLEGP